MIIFRYISRYLIAMAMIAGLCACSESSCDPGLDADTGADTDMKSPDIFLTLDVDVLNSRGGNHRFSRAGDFELPELDCEKLRTLRVIIVSKADRRVEANRQVTLNDQGYPLNDNLTFKVTAGDKYIYLFGNESSMPEAYVSTLTAASVRTVLPTSVDNGTLSRSGTAPIYDWTRGENSLRVPMSERWEVNVRQPATPEDRNQSARLFITRAVSKFSFRFHKSADFTGAS
ncbi:MAG: hypothetical protein K2J06_00430, partial [Muribaculaceae bacterium]|nr:hypothetical protein [Muribaculaceae bacterium]